MRPGAGKLIVILLTGFVGSACSNGTFIGPGGDGGVIVGGDGGNNNVRPTRPSCPGQETTLIGTVVAPNGQDPVPGASVFIPASVPELFPPSVKCEVCGTFGSSDNLWYATTSFDGKFALTDVCPGQRTLVLQNGRFRRVITLDVPPATTHTLTADETRLPTRAGERSAADSVPKIAVATGDYDKMECVLRKMGLDDSAFDLYEGAKALASPGTPLPPFTSLITDLNKLKQYNIIFINCSDNTFEQQLLDPQVAANLKAYIEAGGRLYVTDWSYDWIEQLDTLSPFIDFEPGISPDAPETQNAAAIGSGGLELDATIKDPQLTQWLGLFPGAIQGATARIEHFLLDWVMMHKLHKDVKVWVEGSVSSRDGQISGVRPLTVTFNFKNCGKVLFSSYHTEGRDDEFVQTLPGFPPQPAPKPYPQYCGGSTSPQDRILEYLIFDIANCVKPVQ